MEKGIFASIFDFSFTEFVTTRIIKIIYIISIILSCVAGILVIFAGLFADSGLIGVLSLVFGPLLTLLYILFSRIGLEMVIVVFRIAEHTGDLVQLQSGNKVSE